MKALSSLPYAGTIEDLDGRVKRLSDLRKTTFDYGGIAVSDHHRPSIWVERPERG